MRLTLIPLTQREAKAYVRQHHRHLKRPPRGALFQVGAMSGDRIVGVAIVGRPTARLRQDGFTCEITRLCTDGTRNASSFLYGAACRAAFALGYDRIGTYTLPEESGASLRGSGFRLIGQRGGGKWSRRTRPRADDHPQQRKLLWETSAREVA